MEKAPELPLEPKLTAEELAQLPAIIAEAPHTDCELTSGPDNPRLTIHGGGTTTVIEIDPYTPNHHRLKPVGFGYCNTMG